MTRREVRRILVVDDDQPIRDAIAGAVAGDGVDVRTARDATEALARIAERPPDLMLSDVRMPGLSGVELLKLLRQRAPGTDVILMTAYDDMITVVAAMREGALDFLVKPLDLFALRATLDRVFDDRRTRRMAARGPDDPQEYRLEDLVGHDARMIQIFKVIGQTAASRATVLVRGESGTGKELIARAIHFNSAAAAEPFVPVNCAALPSTLLESELFGHVRGAFTGAVGARRGRFSLAGAGTIFLDEIGDTSLEFQSKLLRVLQEHEFFPVGAEAGEHTEARVIAATHRNLEELIIAGRFREDLYYRLRVVEIALPALRERMTDLPSLARHLVTRSARVTGRPVPIIGDDALEAMQRYPWPGNVRELENCLARSVVVASGNVIRREHLALDATTPSGEPRLRSMDEVERDHLVHVLEATGGQKSRTSEILGVSRPRLNRLLRKHGLE